MLSVGIARDRALVVELLICVLLNVLTVVVMCVGLSTYYSVICCLVGSAEGI